MAYIGLCNMIMAPLEGSTYGEGFRLSKAVELNIDPQYEDVSDYNDINDLDPEEEFQYAEVTLTLTDEPAGLIGAAEVEQVEFTDVEPRKSYGLGFLRKLTSGRYQAVWLTKTALKESATSQETKGESVVYGVPEYSGKAYPDGKGVWKRQQNFETRENALQFLMELANMEE